MPPQKPYESTTATGPAGDAAESQLPIAKLNSRLASRRANHHQRPGRAWLHAQVKCWWVGDVPRPANPSPINCITASPGRPHPKLHNLSSQRRARGPARKVTSLVGSHLCRWRRVLDFPKLRSAEQLLTGLWLVASPSDHSARVERLGLQVTYARLRWDEEKMWICNL